MTPQHPSPKTPKPSATVIIARQQDGQTEVYLLRRSATSSFLPGLYVFPGGVLEDDDRDAVYWLNHVDLVEDRLVQTLGGPADLMLPYAVAAIRETWEETGLLLADPLKEISTAAPFNRQISEKGIYLSISRLGRWCRWISPELMPHRFDTFFFVVSVDSDQVCRPDNHETVHGIWINPAKALAENLQGLLPLSPPTLVTLTQMLAFDNLDDLMAEARSRPWPTPIMPRLWPMKKSALIIEPWDPDYTSETINVDIDRLEKDVLPADAPFSRLWWHGGIFRPVRYPE